MATRIVITDAYSSIGQAILRGFEHTHFSVLVPRADSLDWASEEQVGEYLDANAPELIINTVGWAEFPTVQQQVQLTRAAEVLGNLCEKFSCTVIHLSSFRVFGGENKSSYDEQDRPSPIGSAGRAFWAAERSFEMNLERYICLRVGWVLDVQSDTLFKRLVDGLLGDGECFVTELRSGSPIGFAPLAKVVVSMVHQIGCGAENWGVMHYASGDACSVEELAEAVVGHLQDGHGMERDCWFAALSSEEDAENDLLKEPVSTALTMRRCRDDFGVQAKSWRQGLGALLSAYLEQQKLESEV